jgi:hypothetical protein
MQAALSSGRTLQCACCGIDVLVCAPCDRGQRYCSAECRKQARLASQRRASKIYQNSRAGRCNHARRQQRWRARQRTRQQEQQLIPKNSDSSGPCQEACGGDLLPPRLDVRPTQTILLVPLRRSLYDPWKTRHARAIVNLYLAICSVCQRRLNIEPPCRFNIEPGLIAEF